jgi:uncharacterized membrane protein
MDAQSKEGPEIVTHRIPRIEIYQVSDDELNRIEESYAHVGLDLTFATISLSSGLAFLIALLSATFSEKVRLLFIVLVVICAAIFFYTGTKWWRMRKTGPNVIAKIRSRKTDPQVPPTA